MIVRIPHRFRGPSTSGNGGYSAGTLATRYRDFLDVPEGHAVEVTLRAPPPLDTRLQVDIDGDAMRARHGDTVVLEAHAVPFEPDDLPEPIDVRIAAARSKHYEWTPETHPFPECFTCGVSREPGDGLRIFAGRPDDTTAAAAPWVPDLSLWVDGSIPEPVMWAALDCPGYAGVGHGETAVLGRMTAVVHTKPQVGERCVAMGWSRGRDGRKLFAGTAVYGADGRLLGTARQTWLRLDE